MNHILSIPKGNNLECSCVGDRLEEIETESARRFLGGREGRLQRSAEATSGVQCSYSEERTYGIGEGQCFSGCFV